MTYETLDLSALANRGLRDDKAGDGIGWLDWGPEQDIRDFPTGDVNLGGVPFKVAKGDKNAVVLRVNPDFVKSLADCPESVEIPVAKKNVAGLVFLHTGGWASGLKPFGWREIHYADGTKEVMALNNTNFADWNYGHDQFPDEEGTTTNVAWKGACKNYPVTRVYMTTLGQPASGKGDRQDRPHQPGSAGQRTAVHRAPGRDRGAAGGSEGPGRAGPGREEIAGALAGGDRAQAGQGDGPCDRQTRRGASRPTTRTSARG